MTRDILISLLVGILSLVLFYELMILMAGGRERASPTVKSMLWFGAVAISVVTNSCTSTILKGRGQQQGTCTAWVESTTHDRKCRLTDGGEAECENVVSKTCTEWRKP